MAIATNKYSKNHEEIIEKRGVKSKSFKKNDKEILTTCYSAPIHYLSEKGKGTYPNKEYYEDIDVKFDLTQTEKEYKEYFLFDKNKFTVGIRNDGKLNKFMGIREKENSNGQLEMSLISVFINDEYINLDESSKFNIIDENIIDKKLNEDANLQVRISSTNFIPYIKVNKQVYNFSTKFKLDLSNITILNDFDEETNSYIKFPNGTYRIRINNNENYELNIAVPFVEIDNYEFCNLEHNLELIDGELIYTKYASVDTIMWLSHHPGPYYFDANYDADTADSYITKSLSSPTYDWDDVEDATSGIVINPASTTAKITAKAELIKLSTRYTCDRTFIYYDTSDIPAGATVTSAESNFYVSAVAGNGDNRIAEYTSTITDGGALVTGDYQKSVSLDTSAGNLINVTTGSKSITYDSGSYDSITLNGTYVSVMIDGNYDDRENTPSTISYSEITIYSANAASNQPYIAITYTEDTGPEEPDDKIELAYSSTSYDSSNDIYLKVENVGDSPSEDRILLE